MRLGELNLPVPVVRSALIALANQVRRQDHRIIAPAGQPGVGI
jgi:hypothetical protein